MGVAGQLAVLSCLPLTMAGWYIGRSGAREDCNAVCAGIGPCNAQALNDIMRCSPGQVKTFLAGIAAFRRVNDTAGSEQTTSYDCSQSMTVLTDSNATVAPFADAHGLCGYSTNGAASCDSQPPLPGWVRHCCCEEHDGDCAVSKCPDSPEAWDAIPLGSTVALTVAPDATVTESAGVHPVLTVLFVALGVLATLTGLACIIYFLLFAITMLRMRQLGHLDAKSELPL
ncbi:unnamed protein product [Symbiodinium natans]|uniref:Uncharacterized protein n=1 Tax=Symbiodinium natans TaxID=878477 RepID=A0A812NZH6_9DINO|nr:unnamed protein product [Symbiodinium natans]